ncbi:hypothetical protein SAMN05660206_102142 [Sphingobacterium wenxiniae]|uniref:Uncharacterized protein n=1 Tax=Sphingobacterium wenxiniae TaxID=683125 RepID=A0A1I6Q625_9SPHI|nr:hypothetical protein SAMN05660206_102142 [Sphingobacterium wenxiniae]
MLSVQGHIHRLNCLLHSVDNPFRDVHILSKGYNRLNDNVLIHMDEVVCLCHFAT